MPLSFKSPLPKHTFTVSKEKAAITRHFTKRKVPKPTDGRLLLASWNIANLGVQGRTQPARDLITHILKRFDLIAVQEVKAQYRDFEGIVRAMGSKFDYVMTDTAGNTERLAYVYNTRKVQPRNLFGELALRDSEFPKRTVRVRYLEGGEDKVDVFPNHRFRPFDRNPFIGSFQAGSQSLTLVNTHLYFGKFQNSRKRKDRERYARRVLEIYALARWAGRRPDHDATYDKDMILLGDMNVPAMQANESTSQALVKFGYQPLDYVTKTAGSNLNNDKTYDQMAFAPGTIQDRITDYGVFDFDKAVFEPLWVRLNDELSPKKALSLFNRHVKHHLSDHRPLWIELDIS